MNQYFENNLNLKSNEHTIKVIINKEKFEFITDNGVFSKKGLDFGTRSLLEKINIDEIKGKVLDIGCGYGAIGIYIAKVTDCEVHMIDINERSLKLAKKNSLLNKVETKIYKSNIYDSINEKFDFIISNPPIRVGKEILYRFLFEANDYLKPDGKLIIVINKNQGAKSTIKDLTKIYDVTLIDKNKGFYIISCKKIKN